MQGQQELQLVSNVENKLNFTFTFNLWKQKASKCYNAARKLLQWQHLLKVSLWKHEHFIYNCVQ